MFSIEQRDEQLIGKTAAVRDHISFERAARHIIKVRMEIDTTAPSLVLGLPVWIPGSYKVREFSTQQGNVRLYCSEGKSLPWEWTSKNTLKVQTQGSSTVVAEYIYYSWEPGIRGCNVSRNRAFLNTSCCLMFVEGREQEVHHVYLHHDRKQWKVCSTPLSPVSSPANDDSPLVLGALNYDILVDSPIEIGNHAVSVFKTDDSLTEVAIIGNTNANYDIEWLTVAIERIVKVEAALWGEVPYDRYVFMIQLLSHARSGLEHTRCSVNGLTPGLASDPQKTVGLLNLLVHEFFHTWNVKRLRPVELGPFDYNRENYTSMLWLAEGLTSYYDSLLTYRCGFYDQNTYLQSKVKDILSYYLRSKGKSQMSIKDSSYLAWVKLYFPLPDSGNRFTSYYQHGAFLFLLLDLWILGATNGKLSLDSCLPALWQHYKEHPERGVTQEEVLATIEQVTGLDIAETFAQWLDTTDTIDPNTYLKYVGLEVLEQEKVEAPSSFGESMLFMPPKQSIYCGFTLKKEGGAILIDHIKDDTPADAAGLGTDDEIIAINGERVTSTDDVTTLLTQAGAGTPSTITASCDGIIFTTTLTPEIEKEYVLRDLAEVSKEQKKLRKIWLKMAP